MGYPAGMLRRLVVVLVLLVTGCATAPKGKAASTPAAPTLRAARMGALLRRIAAAKVNGTLPALRASLEKQARSLKPWAVDRAAFAQIDADAEGAWNRFHQVVGATANEGGAAYWAHLGMAAVNLHWGVLDQAAAEIKAALALAPASAPALTFQGRLALHKKDTQAAMTSFKAAVKAAGGPGKAPAAAVALARLELAAGHVAEAGKLAAAVVAAIPDDAAALAVEADVAEAGKGGAKAAAALLVRAVKASPHDVDLRVRLATAEEKAGDPKAALGAWQAVAKARPGDRQAVENVVRLARSTQDTQAETAALEALTTLDPKDVGALTRLAHLQHGAGDNAAAVKTLGRIVAARPKDGAARLARGAALQAEGDLRMALADDRAAVTLGAKGAKAATGALETKIGLPEKPISGPSPNRIYRRIAGILAGAYRTRLKTVPSLGGTYTVKIWVAKGRVVEANVAQNTLHDPILEALAWWMVEDARFPMAKGRTQYTLPFTFAPPTP